jgi:hypothetical protein
MKVPGYTSAHFAAERQQVAENDQGLSSSKTRERSMRMQRRLK